MKLPRRRFLIIPLAACATALGVWLAVLWMHNPTRGLPSAYVLQPGNLANWQAFGGTWNINKGTIENDSDDRGAKIMIGSPYWRNYSVEADMELLGAEGDAGILVRSSNEEIGVDALDGYYAGLRGQESRLSLDNSLLLGMENYQFTQLAAAPIPGGVQPFHWYHIKLLVYRCHLAASVTDPPGSRQTITISATVPHCFANGRIGLRSYASGGRWKNIRVQPATRADLDAMLSVHPPPHWPRAASLPAAVSTVRQAPSEITSIHQLRLLPFVPRQVATIRGVVIATAPQLFIQDPTGGAAVQESHPVSLKIGDEVQATGLVSPGSFSPTLNGATVRLLWTSTPIPPLFPTVSQASTGAYDATFVEVKGRVQQRSMRPDSTLVLYLRSEQQTFQAILHGGQAEDLFHRTRRGSLVTVRGVCVVSSQFTHNLTPFAVLLRSGNDLDLIEGPPWWTPRHIIEILIVLFLLALLAQYLHGRVERWRMRAMLDERERLAHEMHDTLAQSFAGIGFQLEAIRNQFPTDTKASAQLDVARNLVRYSHEQARQNILSLRPEFLASCGVVAALKQCAEQRLAGGHIRIATEGEQHARDLPPMLADTFYRIGQEAVANAIRHANPSVIEIGLERTDTSLTFAVKDDGSGFDSTAANIGFGIGGMRKRARMISAAFRISTQPGRGTTVSVTANLPPQLSWRTIPSYTWKTLQNLWQHGGNHATRHPHSYR